MEGALEAALGALRGAEATEAALAALEDVLDRLRGSDVAASLGPAASLGRQVLLCVATRWLPLITPGERERLFDGVFLSVLPAAAVLLAGSSAAQEARGGPDAALVGAQVARLLRARCERDGSFARQCMQQALAEDGEAAREAAVARVCRALATLPDLVLGSLGGEASAAAAAFFAPERWSRTLAEEGVLARGGSALAEAQAVLADLLARRGQIRAIAAAAVDARGPDEAGVVLSDACGVFAAAEATRCKLLGTVLEVIERRRSCCVGRAVQRVRAVLDALAGSEAMQGEAGELLHRRVLLERPRAPPTLWAVVAHLELHGPRSRLVRTAAHLAGVWANPAFVRGTERHRHRFVTGALLCLMLRLERKELEASGILVLLVEGVQAYLESGLPEVRTLGMIVADAFAHKLGAAVEGGAPIFDELRNGHGDLEYDPRPVVDESCRACDGNCGQAGCEEVANDEPAEDSATALDAQVATEAEADDPDGIVDLLAADRGATAAAPAVRGSVWSDSDDDSDDDDDSDGGGSGLGGSDVESLAPMGDLSEKPSDPALTMPSYLADCLPMLRDDKDYRRVETVLGGLAALLERGPSDLELHAQDAAAALVHAENRFALDGFDQQRRAALAALAGSPAHATVVAYLSSQVLAESAFTSVRLLCLDCILGGAQHLAADSGTAEPAAAPKAAVSRVGTVTREWGRRKQAKPREVANRFASAAPHFMLPLLADVRAAKRLFEREPAVLSRAIFVLGALLGLARNSFHVERLAAALVGLLWWARYNPEALVRRAALFAFSHVLASVPSALLAEDAEWLGHLTELREWTRCAQTDDADGECRAQAARLFRVLGGARSA